MKKFLFAALLVLFAGAAFAASSNDSIVVDSDAITLSADELENRIQESVNSALGGRFDDAGNSKVSEILYSMTGILIPSLGIICPFAMICIVILIVVGNETKRRRMKYNMVEKAIEKGMVLPEYVFYSQPKETRKNSTLNTAIILLAVGIAVSLFFAIDGDLEVAALTSMIWLIGAGKLVVYILDAKKAKSEETQVEANNNDNPDTL